MPARFPLPVVFVRVGERRFAPRPVGVGAPRVGQVPVMSGVAAGDAVESATVREEAAALTGRLPHSLAAWECRGAVAAAESGFAAELEVLEEALAALPGSWDLLDRKALLLAESAQYEAALGMVFGFDHAPRLAKPLVVAPVAERSPGMRMRLAFWSRARPMA